MSAQEKWIHDYMTTSISWLLSQLEERGAIKKSEDVQAILSELPHPKPAPRPHNPSQILVDVQPGKPLEAA